MKIHPTAWVENSVLEAGAEIEAFASVKNSHVGASAKVAAHTILDHCVLGAGSQTLVDSHLRRVIVGQNTTIAGLGLLIPWWAMMRLSLPQSLYLARNRVNILKLMEKRSTGPLLSVHRRWCCCSARALFQAGTALKDGMLVVGRPDEVASRN